MGQGNRPTGHFRELAEGSLRRIAALLERLKRFLLLWLVLGMCYLQIEAFWRGWTNISMTFVGGLCGVFIGVLNEFPRYYKLKIWLQCLIGTGIIVLVEFVSGYILNVRLGLNIWDYSGLPLNVMGQVCLLYAGLWFLLTPFAIWLDDIMRYKLYGQGESYGIFEIYKELFTLK